MTKYISLTKGKKAIVDDDDYDKLNEYSWSAKKGKLTYYARRGETDPKTKKVKMVYMHHAVKGTPPPGKVVDHKNGNGLDNRKSNLRIVSPKTNANNRKNEVAKQMTNKNKPVSRKAYVKGSLNDLENRIRRAVISNFTKNSLKKTDLWVNDIIPDQPVESGKAIVHGYDSATTHEVIFTIEGETVELGESIEVEPQTNYVPTAAEKIGLVFKDAAKRLVTSPVILPGCEDCDAKRGEKVFTEDEVEEMAHKFNTFRMADQMHIYGATGQVIGEAVENWTLKKAETVENILGETITLPKGTWMATVKVTDDATWKLVEDGTYKGFSGTFISGTDAEKLLETLQSTANKSFFNEIKGIAEKRTLIADLKDPTPVTISLVPTPCVPNAIFTSVKSCPACSEKAGRTFSNTTLGKMTKIQNSINEAVAELKSLFTKAEDERTDPLTPASDKMFYLEVDKMDEKEFEQKLGEEVDKALDEKLKPLTDDIGAIKTLLEAKKEEPAAKDDHSKDGKDDGVAADKTDDEDTDPETVALKQQIAKQEEDLAALKAKLGLNTQSNKLKEPDGEGDKKQASTKSFYEQAGLDLNGRPLQ